MHINIDIVYVLLFCFDFYLFLQVINKKQMNNVIVVF